MSEEFNETLHHMIDDNEKINRTLRTIISDEFVKNGYEKTPRHPTEQLFLKEVANHQMAILRDDGVNRHVRFRQPNTNAFMFEIITWPGYLCFCGDMGTYVFSRIDDMFQFFRMDPERMPLTGGNTLPINPSYWGEKLVAESTFGHGYKTFSADKFREAVKHAFDSYVEGKEEVTPEADADLWQEIESLVLADVDNEYAAMYCLSEFRSGEFEFTDYSEYNLKDYTWHFIWCCYALVWAIKQYDEARQQREAA